MKYSVAADQNHYDDFGTRIMVDGMDLTRFQLNPLIMYYHDTTVGRATNLRVEKGQLRFDPEFDNTELGRELAEKHEGEYLRGWSVRVRSIEESRDPDVMLPDQPGPTVTKSELYEISLLPLPSLKTAVTYYRSSVVSPKKRPISNQSHTNMKMIFRALNLPETATETEALDKLNQTLTHLRGSVQTAEAAVANAEREKQALQQRIDAIEAERQAEKIDSLIRGALEAKKILPAEETHLRALAGKDFATVQSLIETRKAYVPISAQVSQVSAGQMVERSSWTFEDWQKKDPDGLGQMRKSDPSAYQQLLQSIKK